MGTQRLLIGLGILTLLILTGCEPEQTWKECRSEAWQSCDELAGIPNFTGQIDLPESTWQIRSDCWDEKAKWCDENLEMPY